MLKSYFKGISCIFSISHTFHATHSLGVLISSPFMNAYVIELDKLKIINDPTQSGKISFIECYFRARRISLEGYIKKILLDSS